MVEAANKLPPVAKVPLTGPRRAHRVRMLRRDRESTMADPLRAAWKKLQREYHLANAAPETEEQADAMRERIIEAMRTTTSGCIEERARLNALETPFDLSDASLARMARFCVALPLADFEGLLHLVPRLVNVVTVRMHSNRRAHPLFQRACVRCNHTAGRGHSRRRHGGEAAARPPEDCVFL